VSPSYWCVQEKALIGLASFVNKQYPAPLPANETRTKFVMGKIDDILARERAADNDRDIRFVDLGRHLCEVRAGQYWRFEKLKSFDEFLERRFPASRRKAYYLMSIHEHLPRSARKQLQEIGWTKAADLAKVARRQGEEFDCATWLHKAKTTPKEQFHDEIDRLLSGKDEASDLVYIKLFKSQIPVVEQALEIAGRMLGTERSRGYCLEMICADFLAGAGLQLDSEKELMMLGLRRMYYLLSPEQQMQWLMDIRHAERSGRN